MDEHSWVNDNVNSQEGKIVIITGANSGIGLETAKILAGKGAHVILACRNPERASVARDIILTSHPDATVEVAELNLSSLHSIQDFTTCFKEQHTTLDILINNAGVMALPFQTTSDGFEMQFGTNHLGHFALTAQLFSLLKDTAGSRIVNLTSTMHRFGKISFDNLNFENGHYNAWTAYNQSKLANALFTYELQKRIKKHHLHMLAVSAHPGYSATNIQQAGINHSNTFWKGWIVTAGNKLLATSSLLGSLPTVFAATNPSIHGGEYIGPMEWFNTRGFPGKNAPSAKALDAAVAKQLWEASQNLTRVHFPLEEQ